MTAFLSLSLLSTLPQEYRLPAWVPIVVISRDLLIVFGWLLIVLITGDLQAQPSRLGKATTFLQMLTIVSVLLGLSFSRFILGSAMVFTILSGIGYMRYGNRVLNFAGSQKSSVG